jgi:hypothetical protein
MAEPRLHQIELRHRQDRYEFFVFAESPEAAISAYGGAIPELAAQRGFLRAYPVPAVEGGEAMTRAEALDAIEARIGGAGGCCPLGPCPGSAIRPGPEPQSSRSWKCASDFP